MPSKKESAIQRLERETNEELLLSLKELTREELEIEVVKAVNALAAIKAYCNAFLDSDEPLGGASA